MSRAPVSERLPFLALLLTTTLPLSCGGLEHEAEGPPAAFGETKSTGGSAPNPGDTAAPESNSGKTVAEIIVDCERHISAWQFARASANSQRELEQLQVLEEAFARYVTNEMDLVREAALIGEARARGVSSTALGFSGDPSVLPILLNNLGDPDPGVVANTLYGLGMLAAPETPGGSLNDAIQRPDATLEIVQNGVFAAARVAQARSRDEERGQRSDGLAEVLTHLLDRPEVGIRAQAASGLGYAQAAIALPQLTNLLIGDAESAVRMAAAFALGEIGDSISGSVLVSALDDPTPGVAGAARGALAKLYGRDLGPDPKAWEPQLRD
ncbi:MAG: HEAT repeat domain-containing protein [Planctomycetes bacterium]|nr:HEAT repeat domain-containing protein [Planctomycetota bacterium]